MTLSIYDVSIPALVRGLQVLTAYMDKAAAHAAEAGLDPTSLVGARLAPDMLPLSGQIQRASDTAKAAVPRLTGLAAPSFPDTETTFDDLKARLANTIAFLESVPQDAFATSAERSIELKFGPHSTTLTGSGFVTKFLLPNFYFHVATAHAILRSQGVNVGKLDYLGGVD